MMHDGMTSVACVTCSCRLVEEDDTQVFVNLGSETLVTPILFDYCRDFIWRRHLSASSGMTFKFLDDQLFFVWHL